MAAEPDAVITWISHHASDEAQALFIGGNGFRVTAAIERLEQQVGRPVLTSKQVLLWSLPEQTHTRMEVPGFGTLFHHCPPTINSRRS